MKRGLGLENKTKHFVIDTREYESDYLYVCDICLTHVQDRTKHCRECNRCVSKFDHHCKWLNNCIGDQNYKGFMYLITIYLISNLYMLALYCIYLGNIVEYHKDKFSTVYTPVISKDAIIAKLIIA